MAVRGKTGAKVGSPKSSRAEAAVWVQASDGGAGPPGGPGGREVWVATGHVYGALD